MQIDISYDLSVNPANFDPGNPAQGGIEEGQFEAAKSYVVNMFDNMFTNNVTVNVDVGCGRI